MGRDELGHNGIRRLGDVQELAGPETVIIEGDWREVEPYSTWAYLRDLVLYAANSLAGMFFVAVYAVLIVISLAFSVFVLIGLLYF